MSALVVCHGSGQIPNAVGKAGLSQQDAGAAGSAEGGGDKGVLVIGAVGGEAIEMRGADDAVSGGAEAIPAHVVGKEDEDIGF